MRDRTLITTGAIGAALAMICCLTPLLAILLSAVGLTAWLATADYVLIPVLLFGVALLALGIYRRRLPYREQEPGRSNPNGDCERAS